MARKEELRFNETKKIFDEAYGELEEAIKAYEEMWYSWETTKVGLTEDQYKTLVELSKSFKTNIPTRDTIIFPQRSTPSELPVQVERKNFFSNIMNFFKRLINRNQEIKEESQEHTEEISAENVITGINVEETPQQEASSKKEYNAEAIIQRCVEASKAWTEASEALDDLYERHLDDSPKGKVIDTKRDGPGILDDYRQSSWGIERICLDGFQNHLPADSKGTKCYLHFLVGNKWVDCETARQHRDKIQKVRFADNGVGFTADNLFYLHSTKTSEDISAGQFGEGMKLASIAAVNLGLGLEFQSRNWRAIVGSEEKRIVNTRNSDKEEIRRRLIYDVTEYSGEPIAGSRTIFHTPTPELIDYALNLPEKVLELSSREIEFSCEDGEIVSTEKPGEAFVKGIYLTNINALFSYNFNNANVNPDRNGFHDFDVKNKIRRTIGELDDFELIKKFLERLYQYSEENNLHAEKSLYLWGDSYPEELGAASYVTTKMEYGFDKEKFVKLWRSAFEEIFSTGELGRDGLPKKTILKTDYEVPEYLKGTLEDYILVRLPENWIDTFKKAGIQTERDIIPEYIEEKLQTSLTLNYGNEIWDEQRIVLDACQNHLPSDSSGTTIFLRFQTVDGAWHDYREFENFLDSDIVKIKIADDGVGYDYKNLGLMASVKDHKGSSGKWGEGLKMLAAAAVRNGVQMELRSRDWVAIPETQTEILNEGKPNEKKVDRLVFVTRKRVDRKSKILDDQDNPRQSDYGYVKEKEKSSTTFLNPTPELIKQFRNIRNNVLVFSPRTPIATANEAEILDTYGGQLYVRNLLIPGNHQLKYSYHLKDFDIETRDRDVIKRESMQKMLRMILENVEEERFIGEFLSNALSQVQENSEDHFLEFETPFMIPNDTELADKWIDIFKYKFGEKTAIRSVADLDADAYYRAQHMGLEMVTLPDEIAKALTGLRGKSGQTIASYRESLDAAIKNAVPVNEEDLTEHERKIVSQLYKYNSILNLDGQAQNPIKNIKVFDYPQGYLGERAAGFARYGDTINISRTTINTNIIEAGHVFFHESVHAITGAGDPSPIFRDYLSRLLGGIAARMLPIEESIEDNGVAQDISVTDITMVLAQLGKVLQEESKENSGEELGDL